MNEISIRKATTDDITVLTGLFDQYRVFYQKESDQAAAAVFLRERINNNESVIFVAEELANKKLVGFTQLYPLFSSGRMKKLWLLNDLFVEPEYRGRQISKLLIEAAKTISRETEACGLMLETAKTNTVGNNLYLTTGFQLEEHSNFYFWPNQ